MLDFKCEICRVTLNESDFESHERGKKHAKNLEMWKRHGKPIPGSQFSSRDTASSSKGTSTHATPVRTSTHATPGRTSAHATPVGTSAHATPVGTPPPFKPTQQKVKRKHAKEEQGEPKSLVPPATVDPRKPFEQQVDDFIAQVCQTQNEQINILKVLQDVAFTFSKVMPGVMSVPYGSQATGLAFRTSDIDVYLCSPDGEENKDFVRQHGRAIHRTRLFSEIVVVSQARVPVVKARHIETGIELDISASSRLAVANSKLLRFLQAYDSRVNSLFMLIGYWAKKSTLINPNKFSRYSINLLIIFYLQTLKYKILPPLRDLVYGSQNDVWPHFVNENVWLLQNRNYFSLDKLFMGFFQFYHTFPFKENVISTYLGRAISNSEMETPEILNCMPYYKVYLSRGGEKLAQRIVCIQDPLELSHNTSKQVTEKVLNQFELACKKVLDMKEKFKVNDWMNEILNGEVCKPVLVKPKSQIFSFEVDYKTEGDWCKDFKNNLTKTLSFLKIQTGSNLPNTNDLKKTKLDNNCLRFFVESSTNPFTKSFNKILSLLKTNIVDFDYFSKNINANQPTPQQGHQKFLFSAQCFVSSKEPGKIHLSFVNEGDPVSFYKIILKGKEAITCILPHVSAPSPVTSPENETPENVSIEIK